MIAARDQRHLRSPRCFRPVLLPGAVHIVTPVVLVAGHLYSQNVGVLRRLAPTRSTDRLGSHGSLSHTPDGRLKPALLLPQLEPT
jgi:hypothetical protein